MQVSKNILVFLFLLSLVSSCGKRKLTPSEYNSWVQDISNGLHKSKQVGELIFDVQFQPAEFVALKERTVARTPEVFQNRLKQLESLQYMMLKIKTSNSKEDFLRQGIESEQEFYDRLYYYSFDFQKDIFLEQGNSRTFCKLFHFERSYDLTNSRTFILAFDKRIPDADKTLVIDSEAIGLGPIKITFTKEDLTSVPEIKL